MHKLKKATLLMVRASAHHWNLNRLYYWSEHELSQMVHVHVFPGWYYHCLYHSCLWIVRFGTLRRLADRAIHTIPYDVRFKMA